MNVKRMIFNSKELFYLYIAAQNWANGDEFIQIFGDDNEKINLVKEAIKYLNW